MKIPLLVTLVIAAALGLLFLAPYPLAYCQYERLVELDPLCRQQVERELFFYTARTIDISESAWGRRTILKSGEYCRQYLILGREPIDIVYDREDQVVHIFPSFE